MNVKAGMKDGGALINRVGSWIKKGQGAFCSHCCVQPGGSPSKNTSCYIFLHLPTGLMFPPPWTFQSRHDIDYD